MFIRGCCRQGQGRQGQQAQRAPFKPELAFPELEGVKEDFVPSPKNQPGQEFPMVNSQGYARFRVDIPHADEITVSLGLGGRGGTKLKKAYDTATCSRCSSGVQMHHIIL